MTTQQGYHPCRMLDLCALSVVEQSLSILGVSALGLKQEFTLRIRASQEHLQQSIHQILDRQLPSRVRQQTYQAFQPSVRDL